MTDREVVTLKEYIDTRMDALQLAIKLVTDSLDKRREDMNEFRAQMQDQTAHFITRAELNVVRESQDKDIKSLRESRATLEGKASQNSVMVSYIIAFIGIAIGIVALWIR